MKEFIAITDDIFYRHPELYDRLVPFSHDVACRHLIPQPLEMAGYGDLIEFTVIGADGQAIAPHQLAHQQIAHQQDVGSCSTH